MSSVSKKTQNKLTDAALYYGFSYDQSNRDEARKYSTDFISKFGIFVGLYNRLNGTTYSVEDSLYTPEMLDSYIAVSAIMQMHTPPAPPAAPVAPVSARSFKMGKKPTTTKKLSYDSFKAIYGTTVAHKVYYFLQSQPVPQSRSEISRKMGMKLATVCGRIAELEEAGLVTVIGTKQDEATGRQVEILISR